MSSTAIIAANMVQAKVAAVPGCSAAAVDLIPDYTLQQIQQLTIVVCPQSLQLQNAGNGSRGNLDTTAKVNIAVLDRCEKAAIPDRLALVENIAAALVRERLTAGDRIGYVLEVAHEPLYGMEEWRQTKVFIATLTATVKVLK